MIEVLLILYFPIPMIHKPLVFALIASSLLKYWLSARVSVNLLSLIELSKLIQRVAWARFVCFFLIYFPNMWGIRLSGISRVKPKDVNPRSSQKVEKVSLGCLYWDQEKTFGIFYNSVNWNLTKSQTKIVGSYERWSHTL